MVFRSTWRTYDIMPLSSVLICKNFKHFFHIALWGILCRTVTWKVILESGCNIKKMWKNWNTVNICCRSVFFVFFLKNKIVVFFRPHYANQPLQKYFTLEQICCVFKTNIDYLILLLNSHFGPESQLVITFIDSSFAIKY